MGIQLLKKLINTLLRRIVKLVVAYIIEMFRTSSLVIGISLACILPMYTSFVHLDYITTGTIGFVSVLSLIAYLFGVRYRLDSIGFVIVSGRLGYLYYVTHGTNLQLIHSNQTEWFLMAVPIIISFGLEYDKFNPRYRSKDLSPYYVWRCWVYYVIFYYLNKFIYVENYLARCFVFIR